MSVSICCNHFKYTIVNSKQRYIKGATTKIKHQDILLSLSLVQTIGNGSCCPEAIISHFSVTANFSKTIYALHNILNQTTEQYHLKNNFTMPEFYHARIYRFPSERFNKFKSGKAM
jgi:hypothetical protein